LSNRKRRPVGLLIVLACALNLFLCPARGQTPRTQVDPIAAKYNRRLKARVRAIVVNGVSKLKAEASEANVIRFGSPSPDLTTTVIINPTAPAELQMNLYGGDVVETGQDTYVTLVFTTMGQEGFANSPENDDEVIIYPNTKATVGSIWTWGGMILHRVRGFFDAGGRNVSGATGGTEFLVNVQDGKTQLIVFDGHVNSIAYDLDITEAPGRETLVLKNLCRQTHEYSLESEGVPGLVLVPDNLVLDPGREGAVLPQLKANEAGGRPGSYHGSINVSCLDCRKERGCNVGADRRKKPEEIEPLAVDVTVGGGSAVRKLEKLEVTKDDVVNSRKSRLAASDAGDLVRESSDAIAAAQPAEPAPHVFPYFDSSAERVRAFKEARSKALLNDDGVGYETLIGVYLDWGRGAKALEAHEKARTAGMAVREPALFRVSKGEAYRLIGKLDEALTEIRGAIAVDDRSVQALNVLGNIYLDKAKEAVVVRADAQPSLEEARKAYSRAVEVLETQRDVKSRNYRAVLQTNLGDVYSLQRDIANEAHAPSATVNRLRGLASQSYNSAAASNSEYVYALTGLGFSDLEEGITAQLAKDNSSADKKYKEARNLFEKVAGLNPMFWEAHAGLGAVALRMGTPDQAEREFGLAIKLNPTWLEEQILLPDFQGQPWLMAVRNILDIGLFPVSSGAGEFIIEQTPERDTLMLLGIDKVNLRTEQVHKKK
jgi:tetratricopeptide (TPR) repeat protein